jgi:hypothetical protein
LAVWLGLWLAGSWRAEREWVDRLGRYVGFGWMTLALALAGLVARSSPFDLAMFIGI